MSEFRMVQICRKIVTAHITSLVGSGATFSAQRINASTGKHTKKGNARKHTHGREIKNYKELHFGSDSAARRI